MLNIASSYWDEPPSRLHTFIFGSLAIIVGLGIGIIVGKTSNAFILIAAAIGMVVAILSLAHIEFGLLIFIIMTYLRLSDIAVYYFNAPSIARPFFILLVAAIALRWAITGNLPRGWFTPAVLIMAYGLIIFGSIFYAADFSSAQAAADDYWKDGLITVLVASLIQNKRIFRYVIWALICSGIFMGTLSVYQYLTGSFSNEFYGFAQAPLLNIVGDTQGNRVAGPIGDPNFYAQIMVVLVPFAINRMANEKSIYLKLLAGFGVIVISLSVILTYSRGGFFALVIALIALGFYRPPRLPLFLSLMAVVWIVVLFLPTTFVDRISTVTGLIQNKQDIQVESSFRGRASEMITAWLMFVDHPVLGVGSHNYPVYYQQYSRQLGLDPRTTAREPHNLYLEIAAETGILGILVFGIIVYFAFRYINFALVRFKESKDKDFYSLIGAYSAGFIGYLTAAMFIHGAYPRYFWLLAGIAYSLKHIAKKEINHQYMKD